MWRKQQLNMKKKVDYFSALYLVTALTCIFCVHVYADFFGFPLAPPFFVGNYNLTPSESFLSCTDYRQDSKFTPLSLSQLDRCLCIQRRRQVRRKSDSSQRAYFRILLSKQLF